VTGLKLEAGEQSIFLILRDYFLTNHSAIGGSRKGDAPQPVV
jgi:hypothetical protein